MIKLKDMEGNCSKRNLADHVTFIKTLAGVLEKWPRALIVLPEDQVVSMPGSSPTLHETPTAKNPNIHFCRYSKAFRDRPDHYDTGSMFLIAHQFSQ